MEVSLTSATLFWLLVPLPLLIVWAIWSYVLEGRDKK